MTGNNDDIFNLRELAIGRDQARENLKGNFAETKERIRPGNLVQDAKSKAVDQMQKTGKNAVETVKSNPGIAASVVAAAALVALRKPLSRLVSGQFRDNENTDSPNTDSPNTDSKE